MKILTLFYAPHVKRDIELWLFLVAMRAMLTAVYVSTETPEAGGGTRHLVPALPSSRQNRAITDLYVCTALSINAIKWPGSVGKTAPSACFRDFMIVFGGTAPHRTAWQRVAVFMPGLSLMSVGRGLVILQLVTERAEDLIIAC